MTNLTKPVKRTSRGLIREAGKHREIIIILRPPDVLGFRAKGCRKEYQLTAGACYTMAVRAHVADEKKRKTKEKKKRRKQKCRMNINRGRKLKKCPKCNKKGLIHYYGHKFAGLSCRYCKYSFAISRWIYNDGNPKWIAYSRYPVSSLEHHYAFNKAKVRKQRFVMDVYVTRNTYENCVGVWDAEIGIVKEKGCVAYRSAAQITRRGWVGWNWVEGYEITLTRRQCIAKYGDYPDEGEAWLVEDKGKSWKWTHVDPDMHLLNGNTGKIIRK